jgi:hypothetical protein
MQNTGIGSSVALLLATASVFAQTPPPVGDAATPHATIVPAAEMAAAVKHNGMVAVDDAVLRVVPVGTDYNVGVSVVRRSQVDGRAPPDAIVHDAITEIYQVTEGSGVLVTGGTIESATPLAADNPIVRQLIGPSSVGKVIRGGTPQRVGPGDIVVIPPRTPHGFVEITTERIVYTLIRVDSQRLLDLREQPR